MVIFTTVEILEETKDTSRSEMFLTLMGRDLIFAGHLILVLQYLYTSLIMPKILLESELKLNLESGERERIVEPTFGAYETAQEAFDRHVNEIQRFRKVAKAAIITFGVVAWVSFTSLDFYLAAINIHHKK